MLKVKKWSGRPVAMPGIYGGMDMEFYHSAGAAIEPSISSSGLRLIFSESPAHYWCQSVYNPKRVPPPESAQKALGRAAHHLLFGEKRFKEIFAVRPERLGGEPWHSNRTACRAWMKQRAEENLTVLTGAQIEVVKGMAAALAAEPLVKAGILNGEIERSWFWKDKATGVWLKIRPDASPTDSLDFCDLKTTKSVQWRDLQRAIFDYGYYQQAALVAEGCRELMGQPLHSFTFLFVESAPPHCVAAVTLKEGDIQRGMKANRRALERFAEGMSTGIWPGPGGGYEDARYIEMPEYLQKNIDDKLEYGATE